MRLKQFFVTVAVVVCLPSSNTSADDDSGKAEENFLQLKPDKCVALRKGQSCYQRLKVSFGTSKQGDYCIYLGDKSTPLQCWKNASKGSFVYVFNAPGGVDFQLQQVSGTVLASAPFTVAWVYSKRSRRSAWRLF